MIRSAEYRKKMIELVVALDTAIQDYNKLVEYLNYACDDPIELENELKKAENDYIVASDSLAISAHKVIVDFESDLIEHGINTNNLSNDYVQMYHEVSGMFDYNFSVVN